MLQTLTFIDNLNTQGLNQIWRSIADLSVDGRPPLYQLMSVPFILLFGRSMDSGVYVNLFFEILLLVATFNIGKLVENNKAGLVSAIIVAAYPPLINLSHIYRPHFAMSACVALTVWLLLLLQKKRSIKVVWLFGLSLAFGFWIHPTFLWVAPVPAAIFCLYIVFSQHPTQITLIKQSPAWLLARIRDPLFLYGLLPAALVSIGVVLIWYLTIGQTGLSILTFMNSPEVMEFRGEEIITVGFEHVPPSFWWYAITSPNALSTVFVVLLVIGMAVSLIKRQFPNLMLLILFVIGYVTLSLQSTFGWRYFTPLLPVAAALTGTWIGRLQNRTFASILTFLCVVTAIFNFAIVNWGLQTWNQATAIVLGVPENAESSGCAFEDGWGFCPTPPRTENWPVDHIIKSVLDDPVCQRGLCNLMVINQTRYFNSSIFEYYAKQNFPETPLSASSLGYVRGGIPFNIPALLNSEYIVYEEVRKVGEGQTYSAAAFRFLRLPPPDFANAHKEIADFILPNGNKAKLIKRVEPLTLNEAETTIAAIDLPEKHKILQYDVLAPLYAKEGDLAKALSYYDLALEHTLDPQTRVEYLLEMGRLYLSLGKTEEAISAYQEALILMPEDPRVHLDLAMAYAAQGQADAAIREFQQVIEYAPGSDYARQAQEWLDNHK
jgi:hypothetical protein